jgi:putative PEP-CTERM system histidine kinase
MDFVLTTYLLCALVYLLLALLLAAHSQLRAPVLTLVAACAVTSLWALAVILGAVFPLRLPVAVVETLDALRLLAWIAFLGTAYRAGLPPGTTPAWGLRWGAIAAAGIGVFLVGSAITSSALSPRTAGGPLFLADIYARLLLAITGLVLAEALAKQARAEGFTRIKYLCLGVGGILGYDLFVWSEALLFERLDPLLAAARGAVSVLAGPLIVLAAARNSTWATDINVSRRAVLHTATLFGVGTYLLVLALTATALRASGTDWGRLLQLTFIFGGLLLLAVIWFSPPTRSLLKLQLSRYLFTHRHDYREQWQRLAAALSPSSGEASLATRVLDALGGIVDSQGGGVWLRNAEVFGLAAGRGLPREAGDEPAQGPLADWLDVHRDGIVELGADLPAADRLPEWLRAWRDAWLLIPLAQRELLGFAVLPRAPGRGALHREDEELLRIAAYHASSYLSAELTTRRLEEARRFEQLSRGMAFLAHDLRNLANELTLTLANARTHIQKPEFQRDLILSMEDSVGAMRRLLDKLAERRPEPSSSAPNDFAELVRSSLRGRVSARPALRLDLDGRLELPIVGDADRLVSMSGHLVQNAIDAAGPEGHVAVRLHSDGEAAIFEVEDDGPGMSDEMIRERLSHPFGSTKVGGFGLGLFECRELARELGGELTIDSAPGRGTVARLRLPLAKGFTTPTAESRAHAGG